MKLSKLFMLTLLATCHFYSASAMEQSGISEKDQEYNYVKIKVKDLDSISHTGIRYDMHTNQSEPKDELYLDLSANLSTHTKTNYNLAAWVPFNVYPSPFPNSNPDHRLYSLDFTRWADVSPTEQTASGKGIVVLWSTDVADRHNHFYAEPHAMTYKGDTELTEMLKASHLLSLKSFISEFQQDNSIYFSPSFPESWHNILGLMKVEPIKSIKKEVITYTTSFSIGDKEINSLSNLSISK